MNTVIILKGWIIFVFICISTLTISQSSYLNPDHNETFAFRLGSSILSLSIDRLLTERYRTVELLVRKSNVWILGLAWPGRQSCYVNGIKDCMYGMLLDFIVIDYYNFQCAQVGWNVQRSIMTNGMCFTIETSQNIPIWYVFNLLFMIIQFNFYYSCLEFLIHHNYQWTRCSEDMNCPSLNVKFKVWSKDSFKYCVK